MPIKGGAMKIFFTILLFTTTSWAHETPPGAIAKAKAAELAVHRIERLVTLKKIDPFFQTSLTSMQIEVTGENGAVFKVTGWTAEGQGEEASSIVIFQDSQGKAISYSLGPIFQPTSPFVWPAADAATLMESSLHFVLEGWVDFPEVKEYFNHFESVNLEPWKNQQGELFALFKVRAEDNPSILYIVLKPDGSFVSYQIK
jgi:hypothetical protein